MTATRLASHPVPSSPRRRRLRHAVATSLVLAILASCASSAAPSAQTGGDSPTSTSSVPPADAAPASSVPPTTSPPELVIPESEMPVVPAAFEAGGTSAEQAAAIATALAAESPERLSAVVAAFDLATLPLTLPDGSSVTSTVDPLGFPWAVVASATELSPVQSNGPLSETTALFALVDPLAEFDHARASGELVDGLRAALTATGTPGPTFLAHLVAEEARRFDGTELADVTVTAEQLHVSGTTSMLVAAAALRGVYAGMVERGAIVPPPPSAGFVRSSRPTGATTDPNEDPGCDDGAGGWLLWVGSKIAMGAVVTPGVVEWQGLYTYIAELGVKHRGWATDLPDVSKAFGKFMGVAGAIINVALLHTQVASRRAVVTMDGAGPLVRTKTTSHGEARTINVLIEYGSGDPNQVRKRNCMLAALAVYGNNAQQALGRASNVEVEISGANGFANSLAAGDSIVLFGPEVFQPIETADEQGRISFQVQGRAQRKDKSDVDTEVPKEFSVFLEASLDPVGASQIGRAFADDLLCAGTVLAADVVDAIAECQNAVIDIVKQFHWDLGEFSFPLTDWGEEGAWKIDGVLGPYHATMIKCGGIGGTWDITIESNMEGVVFNGVIVGELEEATAAGTFVLAGEATVAGLTLPYDGMLEGAFVQDSETTGTFSLEGQINDKFGGGSVPVTRTTCNPES